jgi:hypothetical protein
MDDIIHRAIVDNLLNRYRNARRTTLNHNAISTLNASSFISSRYYTDPPPGGYAIDEEHNYILPNDDSSIQVVVDVIMSFGSPGTTPPKTDSLLQRREQIKSIGKYKKIKDTSVLQEKSCPICIDEFVCGEYNRTLDCGHVFHKKCIDRWFKKNHSDCPMCRKVILK